METLSSRTDFQSSFPGALIEAAWVSLSWDERGRGRPSLHDAASSRSAANGADSIIIIKFNWHATPWPIVAVALNGLDFLLGCFPSDRFCFAPGPRLQLVRLRGMELHPVEDELLSVYT